MIVFLFPQKNKTLKYLRMTGNKIENTGGMSFAAMLQINSSLEKLDLGDCDLVSPFTPPWVLLPGEQQEARGWVSPGLFPSKGLPM